jgi:glycosyltransferase involved in cell wall biosynthesis
MEILKKRAGRKPKQVLSIAIDCGSLLAHTGTYSGIATITAHLLEALSTIDKRNHYILYSFSGMDKTLLSRFDGRVKNTVFWPARGYLRLQLPLVLAKDHPDVFLALSQAIPHLAPPTIGFIYDVGFMRYPTLYPYAQSQVAKTQKLAQMADIVVTTSKYSKAEIERLLGLKDEKVVVAYPGVGDQFMPEGLKYISTSPYFLFVGHLKPSKNIPRLLEAFAIFLAQTAQKYQLVLIGSRHNEDPEIKKTISQLKLESSVLLLGMVSSEELAKYYRGSLAFVSPALIEGFGLPILEALSCGTPVITSKVSSMPEIVSEAALLVDPENTQEIAQALSEISQNKKLAKKLSKAGIKRAKLFSWKLFAKLILSLVEKTAQNEYNKSHA